MTQEETNPLFFSPEEDQEEDVNDWEDEEEFPRYGLAGSMENPDIHGKYIADGVSTLLEVAECHEGYAGYIRDLHQRGWELSQEVDNSHGFVEYVGKGDPPEEDKAIVSNG